MAEELPKYKQHISKLTVDNLQQDIIDDRQEQKWKELNMGIDQWKHKYLYPFGQIQPKKQTEAVSKETSVMRDQSELQTIFSRQEDSLYSVDFVPEISLLPGESSVATDSFQQLSKQKYLFPAEKVHENSKWVTEL
jgi:hypothetical protein